MSQRTVRLPLLAATVTATVATALAPAVQLAFPLRVKAQTAPSDYAVPPLLAPGTAAPDFSVAKWGGGNLRLSDYRGKIVVLDFWASWCGPCQKSMPHIERVVDAVRDKGVVAVGVDVFDKPADYQAWVPAHQDKLHFVFGTDPAARNTSDSIANREFGVHGIPCTFVIDRSGKVAAALVGYGDGDTRLEAALAKLGVHPHGADAADPPAAVDSHR